MLSLCWLTEGCQSQGSPTEVTRLGEGKGQGARGRGRLTADLESQSLEVYNFAPRRARADLNADLESLSK